MLALLETVPWRFLSKARQQNQLLIQNYKSYYPKQKGADLQGVLMGKHGRYNFPRALKLLPFTHGAFPWGKMFTKENVT